MSTEEKVTSVVSDLPSAVAFLKEKAELGPNGFSLKKQDAIAFMAAAGVPKAAHKQVCDAENLLLQGMFELTTSQLLVNIEEAKKKGIDVASTPVKSNFACATMSGKHFMQATSMRNGRNPKTEEITKSFGRVRLVTDMKRSIPKENRQDFIDRCKAACGC